MLTISTAAKKPDWNNLRFGHHFSDHMVECHWTQQDGWGKPQLSPIHMLQLHPAAKCLHYATQLFEGMKAYRGVDNKIRLFRPELNMVRMRRSARRACLPPFDGKELLKIIADLISIDQEWVPYSTTSSLYVRPTFIGTDATLGVAPSLDAMLFVVIGPVGAFYPTGFKPIGLYADPSHIRSWPGGVGSVKMGSNYAPTILIGKEAVNNGCQQALWLFGEEEHLTEVGTMNIFIYWRNEQGENELVTPPLENGLILPGVTRHCLLELTREWNEFKVSERRITMKDIIKALKEDRMLEMFGAGTACIVSPVDRILYKKGDVKHEFYIPTMEHRPCLMQRLFDAITDIQYGRAAKPGWTKTVVE